MNSLSSHDKNRAWAEINLDNLIHNAKVLSDSMPEGCKLMAVIKADAYGHGIIESAIALYSEGYDSFGVATLDEAIALRKAGIGGEILIMSYTDPSFADDLIKYDISQLIPDYEYAKSLCSQKGTIKGHIKVDTGMHRIGFPYADKDTILKVFSLSNLKICGICTHLSSADGGDRSDIDFTDLQVSRFSEILSYLKENGVSLPKIHIQSSYGLLSHSMMKCDLARVGIALYGVPSADSLPYKNDPGLLPVLSLKARITCINDIKKGEPISYGRTFTAQRDTKTAILAIGYADGYPRNLSGGKGIAFVGGKEVPVLGRICMDQTVIDVTDIEGVKPGDVAELIGENITAARLSEIAGTITNELLCRLGPRIPRVFIRSKTEVKR